MGNKKNKYICIRNLRYTLGSLQIALQARIAQLVEHDLAKVGVAGSSPVSRSILCPGGGIGRRVGLKIQWPYLAVRVQVPPWVPRYTALKPLQKWRGFFCIYTSGLYIFIILHIFFPGQIYYLVNKLVSMFWGQLLESFGHIDFFL